MAELAFNYKGQRFAPPSDAMFWRVRRVRDDQRGQLDVVSDAEGAPLIVPLHITRDDFRAAVGDQPGRYRLDALDEEKMPLKGVDAAYVMVKPPTRPAMDDDRPPPRDLTDFDDATHARVGACTPAPAATVTAPFGTWPALPMPGSMTGAEYLLAEAMRGQVQMFQMLTSALSERVAGTATGASQMMGAAAELVRAADGAAMTRRPPRLVPAGTHTLSPGDESLPRNGAVREEDGDGVGLDEIDDDQVEEPTAADGMLGSIMALIDKVQGVVAPVADVARMVMGGFGDDSALRNVAGASCEVPEVLCPDLTHLHTSHMLLVGYELGADGSLFRRLLMAMEPADRTQVIERLCSMPMEEAVALAGAMLARLRMRRRASASQGTAPHVHTTYDAVPGQPQPDTHEPSADDESLEQVPDAHGATLEPRAIVGSADEDAVAASDNGAAPAAATASVDVMAHLKEIAKHLRMSEVLQSQSLIRSLSPSEREAWIARLGSLAPADAAAVVRAELARRTR